MKSSIAKQIAALGLIILLLLLAGCIPKSARSSFYMLESTVESSAADMKKDSLLVFGPVEVAEYLNQPQIVTRQSSYQYHIDDFNRWAEPLKDNFTRIMIENLSSLRGAAGVERYPNSSGNIDYQVAVEVLRFDCQPAVECQLVVRWSASNKKGTRIVSIQKSYYKVKLQGSEYHWLVAALSDAASQFAVEISRRLD